MGGLVVAIFVALTIADALTTYVGVAYFGLREGHPLLWFVNDAPWAAWPVALAQIATAYIIARRWGTLDKPARSALTRLLLAATALRALAVVNNAAALAGIHEVSRALAPVFTYAYLAAAVVLVDALRAAGKPTSFSKSGWPYLLPWRRPSSSPWSSWPSSPP
jgi:hypothetical protein